MAARLPEASVEQSLDLDPDWELAWLHYKGQQKLEQNKIHLLEFTFHMQKATRSFRTRVSNVFASEGLLEPVC